MKFYSYNYLVHKVEFIDWYQILFIIFLLIFLAMLLYQYYNGKKETKYRELAIITVITIFLILGIKISRYQVATALDSQNRRALYFIEMVSKDLKIDKEKIYINTVAAVDGAIIKVNNDFYRLITGEEIDKYLLEKIDLYKFKIELMEVK